MLHLIRFDTFFGCFQWKYFQKYASKQVHLSACWKKTVKLTSQVLNNVQKHGWIIPDIHQHIYKIHQLISHKEYGKLIIIHQKSMKWMDTVYLARKSRVFGIESHYQLNKTTYTRLHRVVGKNIMQRGSLLFADFQQLLEQDCRRILQRKLLGLDNCIIIQSSTDIFQQPSLNSLKRKHHNFIFAGRIDKLRRTLLQEQLQECYCNIDQAFIQRSRQKMKKIIQKLSENRGRAIKSSFQKKHKDNCHSEDFSISQRINNAAQSSFPFHAFMHHEEIQSLLVKDDQKYRPRLPSLKP